MTEHLNPTSKSTPTKPNRRQRLQRWADSCHKHLDRDLKMSLYAGLGRFTK